jgi:hypothetical protein
MLILQPTSGEKIITIVPRTSDISGTIVMKLRRDGDGANETITSLTFNSIENFIEVTFTPTILEEDSTYYLEMTNNDELWYRDKIYATSQTETEIKTEKHEIGNGTIYKPYNTVDNNTYII